MADQFHFSSCNNRVLVFNLTEINRLDLSILHLKSISMWTQSNWSSWTCDRTSWTLYGQTTQHNAILRSNLDIDKIPLWWTRVRVHVYWTDRRSIVRSFATPDSRQRSKSRTRTSTERDAVRCRAMHGRLTLRRLRTRVVWPPDLPHRLRRSAVIDASYATGRADGPLVPHYGRRSADQSDAVSVVANASHVVAVYLCRRPPTSPRWSMSSADDDCTLSDVEHVRRMRSPTSLVHSESRTVPEVCIPAPHPARCVTGVSARNAAVSPLACGRDVDGWESAARWRGADE